MSNSGWNNHLFAPMDRISLDAQTEPAPAAVPAAVPPHPVTLHSPSSPAGSTLKGPIAIMALGTARDAFTLAFTFTDELKNNLYFFSEAQRLNFNGFRILIWTFIWSYADFKLNLKGKQEDKLTTKQFKSTKKIAKSHSKLYFFNCFSNYKLHCL